VQKVPARATFLNNRGIGYLDILLCLSKSEIDIKKTVSIHLKNRKQTWTYSSILQGTKRKNKSAWYRKEQEHSSQSHSNFLTEITRHHS
jgi:hypothetical protein